MEKLKEAGLEKRNKLVFFKFRCILCGIEIPIEEINMEKHATSDSIIFSHHKNHLLEASLASYIRKESVDELIEEAKKEEKKKIIHAAINYSKILDKKKFKEYLNLKD